MASFGGDRLPFDIVSLIENTSNKLEDLIFIDRNWRYRLTTSAYSNLLHLDTCTNNYTLKTLELYSGEVSSSTLDYIITKLMGLKILDIEAYKLITGETPSDEVFGELTAALQARKAAGVLNKTWIYFTHNRFTYRS